MASIGTGTSASEAFLKQLRSSTGIVPQQVQEKCRRIELPRLNCSSHNGPTRMVRKMNRRSSIGGGMIGGGHGGVNNSVKQIEEDDVLIDEDLTWSDEARDLWKHKNRTNKRIDATFVNDFFKTLRINNKNVTHLDVGLVKLRNLSELSLSANRLQSIDAQYLPRRLTVLQLFANDIDDLTSITQLAPPLVHLGLGYNAISSLDGQLTGPNWSRLMSLDLSHNNLCNLFTTIKSLKSLPKLKNLVMMGNPFSLLPWYRGYTLDSLPSLVILDDVRIMQGEREKVARFSSVDVYKPVEARLSVTIHYVRGLSEPPARSTSFSADIQRSITGATRSLSTSAGEVGSTSEENGPSSSTDKLNDGFDFDPMESFHVLTRFMLPDDNRLLDNNSCCNIPLKEHDSNSVAWNTGGEVRIDSESTHVIRDLHAFRDYIKQGIPFSLYRTRNVSLLLTPEEIESQMHSDGHENKASLNDPLASASVHEKKTSKKESRLKGPATADLKKNAVAPTMKEELSPPRNSLPPEYTLISQGVFRIADFLEGKLSVSGIIRTLYVDTDASATDGALDSSTVNTIPDVSMLHNTEENQSQAGALIKVEARIITGILERPTDC